MDEKTGANHGFPDEIYYEPDALGFPLGAALRKKYADIPWKEISSHNNIPELRAMPNTSFPALKKHLIVGVRKTLKYVPNRKLSDWLVPYTSSGCIASCLYCYLVCNYNKCAYLRVFVNREEMMAKLLSAAGKGDRKLCFEIGSNSDLIAENAITGNLPWTIEEFAKGNSGFITFPTKFVVPKSLFSLEHKGRTIFRMSVNPPDIIKNVEIGTAGLEARILSLNKMSYAGYPCGILIAPVIFSAGWKERYSELFDILEATLCDAVKAQGFIEIIFMTYSYVQDAINREAYPDAPLLLDKNVLTACGRGKYRCRSELAAAGADFFRVEAAKKLPKMQILYIV